MKHPIDVDYSIFGPGRCSWPKEPKPGDSIQIAYTPTLKRSLRSSIGMHLRCKGLGADLLWDIEKCECTLTYRVGSGYKSRKKPSKWDPPQKRRRDVDGLI